MRRILGGGLLALAAGLSAAQDPVDAVVVTATRGPRPSLEIPASVDRIHAEDIREGRAQVNLSESLGRVPGIVVQNRQNYAQDLQISSRGFGARSTFGVRGIRLIADGVPATMPDGQGQAATFALGSAERIEVLRGPFSALYGNSAGGVIVVDTQDGPEVPLGEAALLAGSYDTWRAALKYGGQWGRLNGIADVSRFDTEGYRDHSAARRDHLNAKFKYALSDSTGLTLVANSLRQPDTQDPLGLTRAQVEQNPRQVVANALIFDTRKSVYHDQLGLSLNHRLSGEGSVQAMVYGGQREVEQFLAIPLATQAGPTHSGGVVDLDRSFSGGALRYSKGFADVRLSVGVEHDLMDERRRGFINNNGIAGAAKRDEDDKVTSTDLYVQGEWRFAERWTAHAGVRTSRVEFRIEDHFIAPGNGDDSGERTYTGTTPVAGIIFRPTSVLSVYGNIGRGFETPTLAELAYQSVAGSGPNFGLKASYSRHAEAGVKALVRGGVARVNAALFDIVTRDEIVTDQNQGGRSTFKNVGHTDRNGFELGAETLPLGPLDARVAYTWLKAVFRESFTTVTGTPGVPVTVPAGSLLPGVPRSQLYGELRYRKERYYVQLEGLRKSRVAVNDHNSEFAEGYSVFNLVGGLVQQGGRWRASQFLRIDNFTDRNYVGSVIVNDGNGRFYEPSPRRNYSVGVQASLQF